MALMKTENKNGFLEFYEKVINEANV
jgi:hypothetical protein